eukprot:TRINITY_DN4180_c0_g3_i1.p1 TRINITY_DN4180_c0_g3~~TRINITY_DN4180_c0_g3_i1.p1  ORF type:complete len:285 (-),score=72.24 TRINITY_DN4180_c0_g3_i1:12-866(-)
MKATVFFAVLALCIAVCYGVCSSSLESDPNYWTREMMESAIPRDFLFEGEGEQINVQTRNVDASCTSDFHKITSTSVYTQHPYNSVGKIFFSMGGSNYVCSGSIGASRTVWTAGHCVYDDQTKAFAKNWIFVPGYYNKVEPYGRFTASSLCTTTQWTKGDFAYDYALAVFPAAFGSKHKAFTLKPNVNVSNTTYKSYGYPAGSPFDGAVENTCTSGSCARDTGVTPATVGISCDSTGGSSGGPWLVDDTYFVSLNSYGYSNIKNRMYGPYLDSAAETFFKTNAK